MGLALEQGCLTQKALLHTWPLGSWWSSEVGTELGEEAAERRLEGYVGSLEARVGVHPEFIRQLRKG